MTLEDLLKDASPQLHARLGRARESAVQIWNDPVLTWFTDHTAQNHSEAIIAHLGRIIENLQETQARLTDHELFILLCAAYLHDIGMQHMGRGYLDQFTPEAYRRVRSEHPQQSYELIVKRSLQHDRGQFNIDLEDDSTLEPIALIAKAHGTSYFQDAVSDLSDKTATNRTGEEVRGPLLAALLLIGDELDLHQDRARFPTEAGISPEAALHHYVNHYVQAMEVLDGSTPQVRQFRIVFEFPSDATGYAKDVQEWVVAKLYKQCNLTKDLVDIGSRGYLRWGEAIIVHQTRSASAVKRQMPDGVHAVLRALLADIEFVDREGFVEKVEAFLEGSARACQIDVVETPDCEVLKLLEWVKLKCAASGVPVVDNSFDLAIGHSPPDVLDAMAEQLEEEQRLCPNYAAARCTQPPASADVLTDALVKDIADGKLTVITFRLIDRAEEKTRRWIESFGEKLRQAQAPVFLINTMEAEPDGRARIIRLTRFLEQDIARKFTTEFGWSTEEARTEAKVIFEASKGVPLNVLSALREYRDQRTHKDA